MRAGLIVSVIGHLALALWGLISLPSPKTLDMSNLEAVPVDFVPIDELTKLNLGVTKAEAREEVVPEPPAPKVAEAPPPPPPPPPEPEQLAEPAPPEPAPAPPPPPEPAPEPEPAKASEPAPAPEPPPPPEPAKAAEPEPKPEPPKEAVAKPVPAPVPRPRPAPPKKVQVAAVQPTEEKEESFTDEISAILDKSKPTGSTTPAEAPPTLGSRSGSTTTEMSINELEALRESVTKCWSVVGLVPPDTGDLRVKIKVFLNQDGSVTQPPQILEAGNSEFARTSAEAALRAVRRCAPYGFLPPEKYESWREVNMTFDPRQMFGG